MYHNLHFHYFCILFALFNSYTPDQLDTLLLSRYVLCVPTSRLFLSSIHSICPFLPPCKARLGCQLLSGYFYNYHSALPSDLPLCSKAFCLSFRSSFCFNYLHICFSSPLDFYFSYLHMCLSSPTSLQAALIIFFISLLPPERTFIELN